MATKRTPGRPTVRTPEMADRLVALVAGGVPYSHAARAAGIALSVFMDWKAEDASFRERIEGATSAAVEKRLATIQDAADAGDWRAAEAWLRLVLPMEYGRNRIELTGADGAPLAAGLQLYLPAKVECGNPADVRVLTEGSPNGNGE